jgi:signal peptidase I
MRDHLRAGAEMWLTAYGASMEPAIFSGDRLLVRGLRSGETPRPRDIAVVSNQAGQLVAHWVARVTESEIFTHGTETSTAATQPTSLENVLGVVIDRRARPSRWHRMASRLRGLLS